MGKFFTMSNDIDLTQECEVNCGGVWYDGYTLHPDQSDVAPDQVRVKKGQDGIRVERRLVRVKDGDGGRRVG
jgi:hypothetical protein